jgi:uncharacterized repeat protein (TIGR02543 family)
MRQTNFTIMVLAFMVTLLMTISRSEVQAAPGDYLYDLRVPFSAPRAVTVDNGGNVYVADYDSNFVDKFDPTGALLTQWSSLAGGNLYSPADIAADACGNVYLADGSNQILKFTNSGAFLTQWGSPTNAAGIPLLPFFTPTAVAPDSACNVYVADYHNSQVAKYDRNGATLALWDRFGLQWPYGIALDSDGYAYVADTYNDRIVKFNASGAMVGQWGSNGTGNGQMQRPMHVAVDDSGNVYVSDLNNHRIQVFSKTGAYEGQWGTAGTGTGAGEFSQIGGVATNRAGNLVYVVDGASKRVQVFVGYGNPQLSLTITTSSLPSGIPGVPYSQTLSASSGQIPYSWSLSSGSLPGGLNLDRATGTISGTPATTGSRSFTVQVSEASGATVTKNLTINIVAASPPNIAPLAAVTASTQNTSTGQTAVKAVDGAITGYPGDYTKEWATINQGAGAWFNLVWSTPYSVSQVVLYDRPNLNDNITGATLAFSDGSSIAVGPLNNDGTATTYTFPAKVTTSLRMTVTGVSSSTGAVGLSEIQVFGTPAVTTQYTLSTSAAPSGSGSITANPNSPSYPSGTRVVLTAAPVTGYSFSGWSGGASGTTNPQAVTIGGDLSITAHFTPLPGTLVVTPGTDTTFIGALGGPFIPSSATYTLQNPGNTTITWSALQNATWATLSSNGGSLAPGATAMVKISVNAAAATLTQGWNLVTFTNATNGSGNTTRMLNLLTIYPPNIAPLATVTASTQDTTTGQTAAKAVDGVTDGYPGDYTKEWATIRQGAGAWLNLAWSAPYIVNQVVLFDRPNLNDNITGATLSFSDGTSIAVGPLTNDGTATTYTFPPKVTTSVRMTVTGVSSSTGAVGLSEIAVFGLPVDTTQYKLTTSAAPSGSGLITASPSQTSYTNGTQVVLTASPNTGYSFSGWSGDASGTANPVTVTMTGNLAITANFTSSPGTIAVTPATGLSAAGAPGGPFTPSSATYTLQNTGGSAITWSALQVQPWTTLSLHGGSLTPGGTANVTVSLNAAANTLTAGGYSDTVSFTNVTNGNGNTTRPVNLSVATSQPANIAPLATVTASTQNTATGQTAAKAVDGVITGYPGDYTKEWATTGQKVGAWLNLAWPSPYSVTQVVLYDRPNLNDNITSAKIAFSDGTSITVGPLNNNGSATTYTFPAKVTTSLRMTVTGVSSSTGAVGLSEIQVFGIPK